jgi:hypothetical protein
MAYPEHGPILGTSVCLALGLVERATGKKIGGRKSQAELWPEAVALAKPWRRASPKTGERLSYRDISVKLADAGYVNEHGQPSPQ